MKRYANLILSVLFLIFMSLSYNLCAKSYHDDTMFNAVYLNEKTVSETRFKDKTIKQETISFYKYDYANIIPDSIYQYLIVRVEIVYMDQYRKPIASGYFESLFRYNKEQQLAKCLSTSHGESCNHNKYSIRVFGRPKNLALDIGECFGKIILFNKSDEKDVCKYIFSCDKDGILLRYIL